LLIFHAIDKISAVLKNQQHRVRWNVKEKEFATKLSEAQSSAKSGTKNLKSSNPKGSLLRQRRTGVAGGRGVWGEFRPPYKFWAKSVRIFSKAHRQSLC